jgi:hypothetical protein
MIATSGRAINADFRKGLLVDIFLGGGCVRCKRILVANSPTKVWVDIPDRALPREALDYGFGDQTRLEVCCHRLL